MERKYFTLEQAQISVNKIKYTIKDLMDLKNSLEMFNSINIEYTEDYKGNFDELNFTKINKKFHKISFDFFSKLEELENIGCVIKDLNEGLIDFYSLFEGKEIFLCWKYGEENIEYWHDIEDGFSGRKPINILNRK